MLTTHISDGKKINLIAKRLFLLHKFLPNFYIMQSHTTYTTVLLQNLSIFDKKY